MASYVTPKRGVAYRFFVELRSQADTKLFQVNPTLATGDVKVSKDGGTFANLATLPVVTPTGGRSVQVDVSATEMTSDNVKVIFSDAAGAEWCDLSILIQTTARQIDDLASESSLQGLITTIGASAAGVATAVWSAATRLLTAGTNIVLAKGTGVTGFNDLSAAQVNTEADTALSDAGVTSARQAHLDADVSSRLASSSYTAPDNTTIGLIATAVASLPSASTIATAVWSAGARTLTGFGTLVADIWASTSRTLSDKTGFALTSAYDAAKTAAQASDVPAASITAIKAKTDKLTFDGANNVAADMQAVNGVDFQGDGAGTPFGPA